MAMARIGVVAVHGVIPQARYAFQDQVADELCKALDAFPTSGGPWQSSVVFQTPQPNAGDTPTTDPTDTPTISRVHRASEADPNAPAGDFFDVREAYWSPIDKGKTTSLGVLRWLLTTVFLPIDDTARYTERFRKVAWDIGFVLSAMLLGSACFVCSLLAAAWAIGATQMPGVAMPSLLQALAYVGAPFTLLANLRPGIVGSLLAGVAGAYLAAQAIRAAWSLAHNVRTLVVSDPIQLWSRIGAIAVLSVLAFAGIAFCIMAPASGQSPMALSGFALVVTVLLFQSGRALLLWFLLNFFGDVQIYTTRDENSVFFALREQILELVTGTIAGVAQCRTNGEPYDRVYVMAHSLGSTIALDALMRIYNAQKAEAVPPEAWARIRAFVTFGTSLEKTKYFFNAWSPTASQAYEEWQNDLYGPIFTSEASALVTPEQSAGIFWLNCWYFSDFVSDEINSYRSFVLPGQAPSTRFANRARAKEHAKKNGVAVAGRLVAKNRSRFGDFAPWRLHFVTHGDYLSDESWFWQSAATNPDDVAVIDVLTAALPWAPPLKDPPPQDCFESRPLNQAASFLTPDVLLSP
jgi:hypothetical protein